MVNSVPVSSVDHNYIQRAALDEQTDFGAVNYYCTRCKISKWIGVLSLRTTTLDKKTFLDVIFGGPCQP